MVKLVRYCKICHARGNVIETRETAGVIIRRLRCQNDHRFTTAELQPPATDKRARTANLRRMAT